MSVDIKKRRLRDKAYQARWKAGATPEQLEQKRAKNREYMRKHRAKRIAEDPGYHSKQYRICKESQRRWRSENKDHVKAQKGRYWISHYQTPRARAKSLVTSAALRAARRGIKFNIKWQDIQSRIENGCCEVTGIEFDLSPYEVKGTPNPYAPSIDQIIPSLGYTPDNIRVVVVIYNLCKGAWSDQTVRDFAQTVVNKVPALRLAGAS